MQHKEQVSVGFDFSLTTKSVTQSSSNFAGHIPARRHFHDSNLHRSLQGIL